MAIGDIMTKEEYRALYGRDPVFLKPGDPIIGSEPITPTQKQPMKPFFPGQEIGKSLVQAGGNIANLVTGGRKKFESGLAGNERWGGKVNVPALIGDYMQAGAMTGGAAVPIARPFQAVAGGLAKSGGGITATFLPATRAAKAAALGKNVVTEAALGYSAVDVGGGLKEGEGLGAFKPGAGAITGGLAGGAVSALSRSSQRLGDLPEEIGKTMSARGDKKTDAKLMELIMSENSKKRAISAFKQAGQPGGVDKTGILRGKIRVTPTARDRERMEAVRNLVNPGKSMTENNVRLNNEIERISRNELLPFLQENPRAFNVQTINRRLSDIKMPDLFKTDKTLENSYNLVRQRAISAVEQNPKTMEGLWNARKQFDQELIDQFGDAVFTSGQNNAVRRAARDMRNQINEFIADEIGGTEFRDYMKRLSNIYAVRDNIAEKAIKELGTTRFQRWWRKLSPAAKNAIIWGGGTLATIQGGKIIFGGNEAAIAAAPY